MEELLLENSVHVIFHVNVCSLMVYLFAMTVICFSLSTLFNLCVSVNQGDTELGQTSIIHGLVFSVLDWADIGFQMR